MRNPNRQAEKRRALDKEQEKSDTLIVYDSKHGSTEQYAKWLADILDCDAMPYVKNKLGIMSVYQNIIYGGWIQASDITGLNLVLNNYNNFNLGGKNLYVFSTGLGDYSDESYVKLLREYNYIDKLPEDHYYPLPGRFNRDKLNMSGRAMLKAYGDNVFDGLSDHQRELIKTRMDEGYDGVQIEALKPLIDEICRLRAMVMETGMSR